LRERRASPRHLCASAGVFARLGNGGEARLLNVSRVGALFETSQRTAPGARVTLRVAAVSRDGAAPGRVVRSAVAALAADGTPVYVAAVHFDAPIDTFLERVVTTRNCDC
jgi:hypothetical protein